MNTSATMSGKLGSRDGTTDGTRPRISIAMCAYNGETYLSDQLVSIVKQTQQPDELIACDDGSTDNTLQILDQFSREAPFPVRIYRNQQRLGPAKNFERALSLCSGDFIFPSDQDDVWMPQKVNRLLQALANNPDAGYVFSDALIVDEMLRPMGYTMWESIKFTAGERRRFERGKQLDVLLKHNVVTGATMALRAELRNICLPIPESWFHDAWIALVGSSTNMYGVFVEEPLIQYRQHSQQLIGGRKLSFIVQVKKAHVIKGQSFESQLLQAQVNYSSAMDRLIAAGQLREDVRRRLAAKIQHLQARRSLHNRPRCLPRLIGVSRELLTCRYHRFSGGWKSAAMDLLL